MAIEPEQDREPPRRKFDDVASLFGNIVPPPGALRQPVENRLPPPEFTPPPEPTPQPAPAPPRQAMFQEEAQPAPLPDLAPKATTPYRPRPKELPWPDAFEPRPNFRRREARNWSWLLLIPVGFLAAVAITTLDPRTIRSWLETHVFHRQPVSGSLDAPLLTAPTPVPTPTPLAQIPAEVPTPYPAIPTSPVPVPPGVEVSPPPPTQAETAAAAAAPIHITIQYRRAIPGAEGEARRVAALLQSYGGSIEMHPNPTTVHAPTINYYNSADKTAATALATVLAHEAANWIVRVGTSKNPLGTLDIWLP